MAQSYLIGADKPELWELTLSQLLQQQAKKFESRDGAVFPWQKTRLSFRNLLTRSEEVAKAMLALGLQQGDSMGIIAGNRYEYVESFFGAGLIGCPFAVLNNTYTPKELVSAVKVAAVKLLFLAPKIGEKDLSPHIKALIDSAESLPDLKRVVLLSEDPPAKDSRPEFLKYSTFKQNASKSSDDALRAAEKKVANSDVLSLQFTSGS